jgi:hypothetical protein
MFVHYLLVIKLSLVIITINGAVSCVSSCIVEIFKLIIDANICKLKCVKTSMSRLTVINIIPSTHAPMRVSYLERHNY